MATATQEPDAPADVLGLSLEELIARGEARLQKQEEERRAAERARQEHARHLAGQAWAQLVDFIRSTLPPVLLGGIDLADPPADWLEIEYATRLEDFPSSYRLQMHPPGCVRLVRCHERIHQGWASTGWRVEGYRLFVNDDEEWEVGSDSGYEAFTKSGTEALAIARRRYAERQELEAQAAQKNAALAEQRRQREQERARRDQEAQASRTQPTAARQTPEERVLDAARALVLSWMGGDGR